LDSSEYAIMYQVEDRHWWYQGMEVITRAVLQQWAPFPDCRILDAGCGTGAAMTTYLAEYGTVTGVDLYSEALEFCRKRNAPRLTRASVLEMPFAVDSFDLITSFDVLYERGVTHESVALSEFFRILTPNGRVILRLPAYDWLRGQHDKLIHTNRRYTKKLVAELLEHSGFTVEHLSYANTLLFPLAVIKRLSERIFPSKDERSDLTLNPGIFNDFLKYILASESSFVTRVGLPYGLSVIAVAKK
jgi:ubiquinone/menaquinone biosynthesis C-methylase UbiE